MPKGKYNAPYAGDLRADLLDAAVETIAEAGVAPLSLRAIARRLGVSHAAPKNHFSDKRALLQAIAIEGFERLGAESSASLEGATSAVDALQQSGRAYIAFALRNPGYFRVMWRNELLDNEDPSLVQAGRAVFGGLLTSVLAAQAEGWAEDHDPTDLATVAWAAVHGIAQLQLDGPLSEMVPRDEDAVIEGVVGVLIDGLR
ncbi:MAG: TetR/AcrR family transcriptional regulator [Myxococcota bacterium]